MNIYSVIPAGKGFHVNSCSKQASEGENVESLISILEDKSGSLADRENALDELVNLALTDITFNLKAKIVNALIRGLRDDDINLRSANGLWELVLAGNLHPDLIIMMVDPLLRVLSKDELKEVASKCLGAIAKLEGIPSDVVDRIVSALIREMYRGIRPDESGTLIGYDEAEMIAEILVGLPEQVRIRFSTPQIISLLKIPLSEMDPAERPQDPNTNAYSLELLVLRMPEDVDFIKLYIIDAEGERWPQNCIGFNDPNAYLGDTFAGMGWGPTGSTNCLNLGLGINTFRIFINTNNAHARHEFHK